MESIIKPLPVERDPLGYWRHPAFFTPAEGRDFALEDEFDAWLKKHNLSAWYTFMSDEDDSDETMYKAYENSGCSDCSHWTPANLESEHCWFIASIHDSDDGPVCVWLRDNDEK
ncbi:TPA: hypothetical protein ACPZHQ_002235 [Yersinia enterocolitica]